MKYVVNVSSKAENEISEIFEYIAYTLKNSYAAYCFQYNVFNRIRELETFPFRYSVLDDSNTAIRKMVYESYIIVYKVVESNVIVLRVFHSSTNYKTN